MHLPKHSKINNKTRYYTDWRKCPENDEPLWLAWTLTLFLPSEHSRFPIANRSHCTPLKAQQANWFWVSYFFFLSIFLCLHLVFGRQKYANIANGWWEGASVKLNFTNFIDICFFFFVEWCSGPLAVWSLIWFFLSVLELNFIFVVARLLFEYSYFPRISITNYSLSTSNFGVHSFRIGYWHVLLTHI